MSKGWKTK